MHSTSAPAIWTTLPFMGILLSIALFPLFWPHFWEKNRNKATVALAWSLPILLYYHSDPSALSHTMKDYASFICLIGSLFIVSGGIAIRGDLRAKPSTNVAFLLTGAILANFIGTTGASMLLIRAFLKTNSERAHTWHLPLFFIFIVSNFGGVLTPLGDPPLFLGYLNGVPFSWTLHLFPEWITAIGLLLLIFYLWDRRAYQRETTRAIRLDDLRIEPLTLQGGYNFIFLMGIVGSVFLKSPWREILMILFSFLSHRTTSKKIHTQNQFSFYPIVEVAVLFVGIFITMTPALKILELRGAEFHLTEPWHFFWVTGILSSFLDNAPTYLTFFNLAKGLHVQGGIAGVPENLLQAISVGAVFMGANSYIGNGPNFMVKAIAQEQGFKTLSFGSYFLMAMIILGPIYLLITLIFF